MVPGILRFPQPDRPARPKPSLRPAPIFETVDPPHARQLLDLSSTLVMKAQELVEYAESHREAARQAGVESIAIQVSVVLEGNRLEHVIDALEEAVETKKPVQVTVEGLHRLRRFERLLSEGAQNLARFGGSLSLGDRAAPLRGVPLSPPLPGILFVLPFVILGLALVAYTAVQLGRKEA